MPRKKGGFAQYFEGILRLYIQHQRRKFAEQLNTALSSSPTKAPDKPRGRSRRRE